ncbi:MAG: 3-deoxy-8-phosphooctulonate synthase [Nitrospinaceae bacterium]|jgi:2-dehydro-3-deoxyphosphooctonate aldolase (KDO 8-P synthase)|nr:MAG: 3-deoxy-8-phosphooctulonate synthase [Nitrospinaceae bacterium]
MSLSPWQSRRVTVGSVEIGGGLPLALIAGPCVIESEAEAMATAQRLKDIAREAGVPFIYKSSYDKANRSSIDSYRGPGLAEGLKILERVKAGVGVPVLSDIHAEHEVEAASRVLDVLQIPAFLCRQTDLLVKAARTGKPVNIKKGQFMAPWDMKNVVRKMEDSGQRSILLTERGFMFGYNNMVVDMRSLVLMREHGCPVVYDATHSLQLPGGEGTRSGGQRELVPDITRAAVAVGVDALFMEVHPDPDRAPSDGPNMIRVDDLPALLDQLLSIDRTLRQCLPGAREKTAPA